MMMTHALGWALVDSLWQDALAAAGLAALLALLPVRAARIRYALATLTLGLMLALPLASAVRLSGTSPWTDDVITATSPVTPGPTSGPDPQAAPAAPTAAAPVAARIRAALEPALPWVVLVWFGGVVVLSLRLASGWLVTRQLGRVGTASVPDSCREAVARLARRRAHGPDPAARGAGASGDLPPLDGGRDRRDHRPRRRRPPGEWDGSHGRPGRHATGDARFPDPPRRGVAERGCATRGGEDPRQPAGPADGAAALGDRSTGRRRGGPARGGQGPGQGAGRRRRGRSARDRPHPPGPGRPPQGRQDGR